MNFRPALLSLVAVFATAVPAVAQQIFDIPGASWVSDITPDGQIVAGPTSTGNGYIWRWRVDPAPTIVLGGTISAISDDGMVAAGTIFDPGIGANVAAIWTQADGWTSLGWLPNALSCPSRSTGYDISGDGTTVVGLSWDGCSGRGFRWTAADGMVELESLANGSNRASIISTDGSTIGGFAQGTFSRTPALWDPTDDSGQLIGVGANEQGEIAGLNSDGSIAVGTLFVSGQLYSAFTLDSFGTITNLGSLNSGFAATASDISEDGKTIAGFDYFSLSREAWIWKDSDGMKSVEDRATAGGFGTTLDPLVCLKTSDDGNVLIGGHAGTGGPFGTGGYIFEFVTPLRSATESISLSAGGSQTLDIDFRRVRAGNVYWVFGSATGTSPGITFNGPILPLNFDGYFNLTLTRPNAGIFGNFVGMLDGQGKATASLTIPAGSDPSLAGVVLHHAVTVSQSLGTIDATSNAVSVTLGS